MGSCQEHTKLLGLFSFSLVSREMVYKECVLDTCTLFISLCLTSVLQTVATAAPNPETSLAIVTIRKRQQVWEVRDISAS